MALEEDLKILYNHEHFARFMNVIHNLREETIEELHEATTDSIQQISGRIITYDQILQIANWDMMRERHAEAKKKG